MKKLGSMAYPVGMKDARIMIFVDGENLAIRYGELLTAAGNPKLDHVRYERDVFAWTQALMHIGNPPVPVVRHHYYTSAVGDEDKRNALHDQLAELRIEAPHVFPKQKGRGSKRVDISLSVDMLSHAHRRNYDVGVLVSGDGDYVPLVEAVEREGARVVLWFFENGLNPALKRAADFFFNLENAFFLSIDHTMHFRKGTYL